MVSLSVKIYERSEINFTSLLKSTFFGFIFEADLDFNRFPPYLNY